MPVDFNKIVYFFLMSTDQIGCSVLVGLVVGLFVIILLIAIDYDSLKTTAWKYQGRIAAAFRKLSLSLVLTDRFLFLAFLIVFFVTGILAFLLLKYTLPQQAMNRCEEKEKVKVDEALVSLWSNHYGDLGCPQGEALDGEDVHFVQRSYQRGDLFFIGNENLDVGSVIVTYGATASGETGSGKWRPFLQWSWAEQYEFSCDEVTGEALPIFEKQNLDWCREENVQKVLGGQVVEVAAGQSGDEPQLLLQRFEGGEILVDPDGMANRLAYVLFDNKSYIRTYY